jgi:hypothetical protein
MCEPKPLICLDPSKLLSAANPLTIVGGISSMSFSVKPQLNHKIGMPAFLQAGIATFKSWSTTFMPALLAGRPMDGDKK